MGIFETSLEKTTLCVQPHAWMSTLDNAPSKVFLQVAHSKLHKTRLYLIMFWMGLFISYDSKIDYKLMLCLFLLPSAKWPWQINNFQNINWCVFAEASIFNNGHLGIVAPYPEKNNPYISASFLIVDKLLFMFYSWITYSSYLGIIFLLGGIYVLETFLEKSSTFLSLGLWERLKGGLFG